MAKPTLVELKQQADALGIEYPEDVKYVQMQKIMKDAGEERESTIKQEPQFDLSMLRPGVDTSDMKIHPNEKDYKSSGYNSNGLTEEKKQKMLIRCKVMILDPEKATETHIHKQIWNSKYGLIAARVIPVGRETHVEKAILDNLQTETYSLKREKEVEGEGSQKDTIIEYTEVPKYAVQILPNLTKEQLKKLADDQRKTNRLADE